MPATPTSPNRHSLLHRTAAAQREYLGAELMTGMVEQKVRIDGTSLEAHFEMQVRCGGPARTARKTNNLTSFHLIAGFDKVARLMAVARGEAISMADNDVIAITKIGA